MFYDIIIIGAGPAGLSIGSELSKDFNILVIEKDREINTNRCWMVLPNIIRKAKLQRFVLNKAKVSIYRSLTGLEAKSKQALNFTLDPSILIYWKKIIEKNKGIILTSCNFKSLKHKNRGVEILTSKDKFNCRLLIDASGWDSKILYKNKLIKEKYFCSVYAQFFKDIDWNKKRLVALASTMKTHKKSKQKFRKFMFICPSKYGEWVCTWVIGNKHLSKKHMHYNFIEAIKNSPYFDKIKKGKGLQVSNSIIPLYTLEKYALDNILPVGDAAGWPPAATGTGLNEILKKYIVVSKKIKKNLENNQLSQKKLEVINKFSNDEHCNVVLHKLIALLEMYVGDKKFDDFIDMINVVGDRTYNKFLSMSLTKKKIIQKLKIFHSRFTVSYILRKIPYKKLKSIFAEELFHYLRK